MEHETFEDDSVAAIMNENFICVKVDREERPDVDQIYMTALHLMNQRGGWPLNCIAIPDGKPFWGGTYFQKEDWKEQIIQIANAYEQNPSQIIEFANRLSEGIQEVENVIMNQKKAEFSWQELDKMVLSMSERFDNEDGGSEGAPKFPMPNSYNFLLKYAHLADNKECLDHIEITLENGLNPNNTSSPYIALAKTVFENYPILMGVFFISILSVVMSTIDSYTFLSAITLKYDLNTILKKETNIKGIQQSTIFILIISFFLSSVFDRALYYWYYFGSYLLVSSFFPLIYALFDIKIKNVTLMMISSITITFIWDMLIINGFTQIPSIYIGLLAGFTIINLPRK